VTEILEKVTLRFSITVIDKDSVLTNRLCQSYNDPHITTFDGKPYHYMEDGEFVMYRNDKGPFWVCTTFVLQCVCLYLYSFRQLNIILTLTEK
jgi:hypothetical protein